MNIPTLNILLVDDDATNRIVAESFIRRWGYKYKLARHGREAIDIWSRDSFDIVLMDIQMPEMDGFEATSEIRRQEENFGKSVPIIAMTANVCPGFRETCLRSGMDDYISKPITAVYFRALLEKWARQVTPHEEHVEGERVASKRPIVAPPVTDQVDSES